MGLPGKGRHDSNKKGEISESAIFTKSAWIDEDGTVLKFDTTNHNVTGKKKDWRHYHGQCDYFAVYSMEPGKVYLVPVDDVGTTRAHLRLEPSKNGQEKNVRWAKDYEL